MDPDEKVNAFRQRLQALDVEANRLALQDSNDYRALPAVTYGETRFEQTGFRPVEGDVLAIPDDDHTPAFNVFIYLASVDETHDTYAPVVLQGQVLFNGVLIEQDDPLFTHVWTITGGDGYLTGDTYTEGHFSTGAVLNGPRGLTQSFTATLKVTKVGTGFTGIGTTTFPFTV